MVDWQGLFKWSMQYQDGTHPSEFKEMSQEDKIWLQEALKAYTFNDTDRLQQICQELKDNKAIPVTELAAKLEELQELVELHPRNNLNLCLSGGMAEVLSLIVSHTDNKIRKLACSIFAAAVQNNGEVQKFAARLGALNLT